MSSSQEFDKHAGSYQALHAENLAASGEPPSYFATYKRDVLQRLLGPVFDAPVPSVSIPSFGRDCCSRIFGAMIPIEVRGHTRSGGGDGARAAARRSHC
jgi:hypothetical protein